MNNIAFKGSAWAPSVLHDDDRFASPVIDSEDLWSALLASQLTISDAQHQISRASFESVFSRISLSILDVDWRKGGYGASPPRINRDEQTDVANENRAFSGLGLNESFVPSARILAIWNESLARLAAGSKRDNLTVAMASVSSSERAQLFSEILHNTIASFGQYQRFRSSELTLIDNNGVDEEFQFALLDAFHLIPDRFSAFNRLLVRDVRSSFAKGWRISGEWGELVEAADGQIRYTFRPVETFEDDAFVESIDGD